MLPVIVWNAQNGWITLTSVSESGHLDKHWAFTPANLWSGFINYTSDFIGLQVALENPFFFLPTVCGPFLLLLAAQKYQRAMRLLFAMGVPVFLFYFLLSFHSRRLPNWVVQSIIPFFCLAAVYWNDRWQAGSRAIKYWLYLGVIVGFSEKS